MAESGEKPLVLLIGGSFNPLHVGHLRIAIESREMLNPDLTLFIPTASPPHKPDASLLPFSERCDMLRQSLALLPEEWNMAVSEVENERSGPSYTVDTLDVLAERFPDNRLVFVMGGEDYANLSTWSRWRELVIHADLAIVPRKEHGSESFDAVTVALWPGALPLERPLPMVAHGFALPGCGRILYLPQPLLMISSSLVRQRFVTGRSLDFMVPAPVLAGLEKEADSIRSSWKAEQRPGL